MSLGAGQSKATVFVLAMVAGMAIFEWAERRQAPIATGDQ